MLIQSLASLAPLFKTQYYVPQNGSVLTKPAHTSNPSKIESFPWVKNAL